jgi:hypothetical protein
MLSRFYCSAFVNFTRISPNLLRKGDSKGAPDSIMPKTDLILTRMLRSLTRAPPYKLARCSIYRSQVSFLRVFSTAMATPIASSSQPAAPDGPHAGNAKKPKEKKDKAAAAASQYPLEVSDLHRCSNF